MLKQLRYFQSVVRNGSFSEAAEENFISQSAICTDRPGCPERGMLLDTRPQRLFCLWRFSHSVRRSFREANRHYRIYP